MDIFNFFDWIIKYYEELNSTTGGKIGLKTKIEIGASFDSLRENYSKYEKIKNSDRQSR